MDIPEIGGPQQEPKIVLPELRLFRVIRERLEYSAEDLDRMSKGETISSLETIDVWAHIVQYGESKVLAFFQLVMLDEDTPHQRVVQQLKRVFASWHEVVEVEVPKPKKSILEGVGAITSRLLN